MSCSPFGWAVVARPGSKAAALPEGRRLHVADIKGRRRLRRGQACTGRRWASHRRRPPSREGRGIGPDGHTVRHFPHETRRIAGSIAPVSRRGRGCGNSFKCQGPKALDSIREVRRLSRPASTISSPRGEDPCRRSWSLVCRCSGSRLRRAGPRLTGRRTRRPVARRWRSSTTAWVNQPSGRSSRASSARSLAPLPGSAAATDERGVAGTRVSATPSLDEYRRRPPLLPADPGVGAREFRSVLLDSRNRLVRGAALPREHPGR
jgi:hypothetical protein